MPGAGLGASQRSGANTSGARPARHFATALASAPRRGAGRSAIQTAEDLQRPGREAVAVSISWLRETQGLTAVIRARRSRAGAGPGPRRCCRESDSLVMARPVLPAEDDAAQQPTVRRFDCPLSSYVRGDVLVVRISSGDVIRVVGMLALGAVVAISESEHYRLREIVLEIDTERVRVVRTSCAATGTGNGENTECCYDDRPFAPAGADRSHEYSC